MTKSQLNSAILQLKQQEATLKVVGVMQQSTEMLQTMSNLVSLPHVSEVAKNMAMEMEKVSNPVAMGMEKECVLVMGWRRNVSW